MKIKKIHCTAIIILCMLLCYPASLSLAKTHTISSSNMEITVPDDTIILTEATSSLDELWAAAGITNPKTEKETFSKLGVQAIFYDPTTRTTVRLLQKQTTQSKKIYHLTLLTNEELQDYYDSFLDSENTDTSISIETYTQDEIPFFRLSIDTTMEGTPIKELVYGTIVNGYAISFDTYKENAAHSLDETFIKKLVAGAKFTKILDKAEEQKKEAESHIQLIIGLIVFCIIILLLITLGIIRKRKINAIKREKAEQLEVFFREQKYREKENKKDPVIFSNQTQYTKEMVKHFIYFDKIINKWKMWFIAGLLYFLLFFRLYQTSSFFQIIVALVFLFIFIFVKKMQLEDLIEKKFKSYQLYTSLHVAVHFYDNYFTITGLQSLRQHPYLQLTKVKANQEFIYLYLGSDNIVILKKDGFEQDHTHFLEFIRPKIIYKK